MITCRYEKVYYFVRGLAAVCDDGKWGFVNKDGKEVIPCIYDYASPFGEGDVAFVGKKDRYGLVDKKGNDTFKYHKRSKSYEYESDYDEY